MMCGVLQWPHRAQTIEDLEPVFCEELSDRAAGRNREPYELKSK